MVKRIIRLFLASCILFTAITLVLTVNDKKQLQKERISLILQNDSLHVLQLETKQELLKITKQLDSLETKIAIH